MEPFEISARSGDPDETRNRNRTAALRRLRVYGRQEGLASSFLDAADTTTRAVFALRDLVEALCR